MLSFVLVVGQILITYYPSPITHYPLLITQIDEAQRLFQQGVQYKNKGQLQAALDAYQQALTLYQNKRDRTGESLTLTAIGDIYLNLENTEKALTFYQEALRIYQAINHRAQIGEIFWKIARIYRIQSDYAEAIFFYQRSLIIDQELGNRVGEVTTLTNIAEIYLAQQQYSSALAFYQKALVIQQEIKDGDGINVTLRHIDNLQQLDSNSSTQHSQSINKLHQQGIEQLNQGKFQAALATFQQVLVSVREIKERETEGIVLYNIGRVQEKTGQYSQAVESFKTALTIHTQLNNKTEMGRTLYSLGQVYEKLSQYPQALDFLQQALTIYRELGDKKMEARTLSNLGIVYRDQGKYNQSIEVFRQALTVIQPLGDAAWIGTIFNNLGSVYTNQGKYELALQAYQKTLDLSQAIKEKTVEAATLTGIGTVYRARGDYQKAIEFFQQAGTIYQATQDRVNEGTILNNLGQTYTQIGQYSQALQLLQQALKIHQETGNRAKESATLHNIGIVYFYLAQYDTALDYYNQALTVGQEIGSPVIVGGIFNSIGWLYDWLYFHDKALNYYQQALQIQQAVGAEALVATTLQNIALVYSKLDQQPEALKLYNQALTLQQKVGNKEAEGAILNNIGLAYMNLEKYAQAVELLQQALAIVGESGNRAEQAIGLSNLGAAYFYLDQYAEAEKTLLDAIATLESLRIGLDDYYKISLFERLINPYLDLQATLISQNKTDVALEIAERGKARAFVELLATRSPNKVTNIKPPTIEQIKQIAKQENATLIEYSTQGFIWVVKPTGEIIFRQIKTEDLDHLLKDLIVDTRQSLGVRSRGEPQQMAFIPGDFIKLNSDTPNSEPWQVVKVDAQNNLLFLTLSSFPEGVTIQRPFTDVIAKVPSRRSHNRYLQQLHQLLIEPIADLLPTDPQSHVIFIPDRELFLLPFAALQDKQGNYLIENHTIRISPSIQALDLARKQKGNSSSSTPALVVGNPTMPSVFFALGESPQPLTSLPNAEKEVQAIAQLLGSAALTGDAATKTVIQQKMSDAQIIHLATHGLLDERQGINSAIALAPEKASNGLLTAAEIQQMNLKAQLVVLSACNTGLGRITGDGVIGLSRSFMAAGVPSVLVSLWTVPDAPTADLMTLFYQNLQNNPDKAQALRQAMLKTMEQQPDPRDWAAFTLVGAANSSH